MLFFASHEFIISPAWRFPWMAADPSGDLPHFFACE
jgi:hypothetical protein